MNTRKHKSDVPEEVINYCIDNKLTMEEGLIQLIDKKFGAVDQNLKSLKRDVTTSLHGEDTRIDFSDEEMRVLEDAIALSDADDMNVTDEDIREVESFLNDFNNNNS